VQLRIGCKECRDRKERAMDTDKQLPNVTNLFATIRRQQYTNAGMALLIAILFVMYVGAKGDKTTLLTPTKLQREVSIKGQHMDAAYLEELGPDTAELFLTVNPKTLAAVKDRLLRIVHPSQYGAMSNRIDVQAARLARENASQVFWPNQVLVDAPHNRVAVFGLLSTYINDKRTSEVPKVYVAEYGFSGAKMWLKQFNEGVLDDPFELKPEAAKKKPPATDGTAPGDGKPAAPDAKASLSRAAETISPLSSLRFLKERNDAVALAN
jgi:conjugal transfer pilus assembly protein TraE